MKRGLFLFTIISLVFLLNIISATEVLSSSVSPTSAENGTQTLWNITVTNNGNAGVNFTQINITFHSNFSINSSTNGTSASGDTKLNGLTISWTNNTYLILNDSTEYFWVNATGTFPGEYNITVTSLDTSSNINSSNISVSITSPSVSSINFESPTPSDGEEINYSYIPVNVTVTDKSAVDTVVINLYNSTSLQSSATGSSSPFFNNFTSLDEGTYYINATANDSLGNSASTSTRTITINFSSGEDSEETDTLSIDYSSSTPGNGSELLWNYIFVDIIPNNESLVENITIYLYDSTSLVDSITLYSSPFSKNFTSLEKGTYYVNATAIDTSGNSISLETITLSVMLEATCTPNWDCTDWKPEKCPENETQKRTCTDSNDCDSTVDKPEEIRSCVYEESTNLGIIITVIVIVIIVAIGIISFLLIKKFKEGSNKSPPQQPVQGYSRPPGTRPGPSQNMNKPRRSMPNSNSMRRFNQRRPGFK